MISLERKWEMGRAQPSKIRIGKRAKLRVINDCFGMNIEIILSSSRLVDQGSYSTLKIVKSKPRGVRARIARPTEAVRQVSAAIGEQQIKSIFNRSNIPLSLTGPCALHTIDRNCYKDILLLFLPLPPAPGFGEYSLPCYRKTL